MHCVNPMIPQAKYGSVSPPDYRLDRVTAPTLLFSGAADSLSTKEDNDKIADLLGDAVVHNEVLLDADPIKYSINRLVHYRIRREIG